MFFLEGPRSIIRSVYLLACRGQRADLTSANELRSAYLDSLRLILPHNCVPSDSDSKYCVDTNRIAALVSAYGVKCRLTDMAAEILETPTDVLSQALSLVDLALNEIRSRQPAFVETFDCVVHTLFYARSSEAGGGSASSLPGVIWCSLRKNWSLADTAEFLVHEFTHNALFLDERVREHYADLDAMAEPKNFGWSAILQKSRPLDKVFHSLVVANEVLWWRSVAGEPKDPKVHPPTRQLRESIARTIESIYPLVGTGVIVKPRFVEIFEKVVRQTSERSAVAA